LLVLGGGLPRLVRRVMVPPVPVVDPIKPLLFLLPRRPQLIADKGQHVAGIHHQTRPPLCLARSALTWSKAMTPPTASWPACVMYVPSRSSFVVASSRCRRRRG